MPRYLVVLSAIMPLEGRVLVEAPDASTALSQAEALARADRFFDLEWEEPDGATPGHITADSCILADEGDGPLTRLVTTITLEHALRQKEENTHG